MGPLSLPPSARRMRSRRRLRSLSQFTFAVFNRRECPRRSQGYGPSAAWKAATCERASLGGFGGWRLAKLREQIQQRLQLKSNEAVEKHRFDRRPNDEIEK